MEPLPASVEGDGVVLRRWTPDDADELHALIVANVEHLRPRMPWIAWEPQTLEQRRLLLERWDSAWRDGGEVVYAIDRDGEAVGSCGLHPRLGAGGLEIGYWVAADHLGRGVATAAASALTDAALAVVGIDRVEIHHDATNLASRRVPEKLGFVLVDEVPSERDQSPGDCGRDLCWRITRERWVPPAPSGPPSAS